MRYLDHDRAHVVANQIATAPGAEDQEGWIGAQGTAQRSRALLEFLELLADTCKRWSVSHKDERFYNLVGDCRALAEEVRSEYAAVDRRRDD